MPQNDDDGSIGTTIPVTTTVTGVTVPVEASSEPGITNLEPACRPNVAAVCLVMTTWTVAAGWLSPGSPGRAAGAGTGVATGKCPLSSRTCEASGCRSAISILTGVPPVPGRSSSMGLNGTVMDDQSVPAGVRLTGARSKSACSDEVIASMVPGGTIVVGSPVLLTIAMMLCTSRQSAETVMVFVVGRVAATVCRTAWVRLARVSRAPAVAAKTARKVSSARPRYRARGR